MGKGKNDRAPSNRSRKRRKARTLSMLKHIIKHPKYYNIKNPIPWCNFSLMLIFYMLLIASLTKET